MPAALTTAERFERAEAALAEARRLAESITEETPGRQRAALITKTRTQYNKAYSVLGRIRRQRNPAAADDKARAERILDQIWEQIGHARRFSQ